MLNTHPCVYYMVTYSLLCCCLCARTLVCQCICVCMYCAFRTSAYTMCSRYIGRWMSVYISSNFIVLFTVFYCFYFLALAGRWWCWRAFVVGVRPLLLKHFVVGHWNDLYVHNCACMYVYIYTSASVCSMHGYIDLFLHNEPTGCIFLHVRALVVLNLDVRAWRKISETALRIFLIFGMML